MILPDEGLTIVQQLRSVLDEGLLDGGYARLGRTLLEHLDCPARITVVGQRGVGKTSLLDLILGEVRMPDVQGAAIVELSHGKTARFKADGPGINSDWQEGLVSELNPSSNAFHIVQELPFAQLADKRLAEINLSLGSADLDKVLQWMAANSDMAIWCTQEFDDAEFAIWSAVPDVLRDHSFLVLTKADQLQMQDLLAAQIERFNTHLADEFLSLYRLATKQAFAARKTTTEEDEHLWVTSGGEAFMKGLEQKVASGKMADLDTANLLLTKAGVETRPLTRATAPQSSQEVTPAKDPVRSASADRTESPILPMKRCEAIETALKVINTSAEDMLSASQQAKCPSAAIILEHTTQAAHALATLFMDASQEDAQVNAMRDEVLEYEQTALLLQLEGTDVAAHDAATTLLQLKKEMSEVAFA
ncbi:MAG: hypothetical protein AAF636_12620 [Pseudomonadota bacterium]